MLRHIINRILQFRISVPSWLLVIQSIFFAGYIFWHAKQLALTPFGHYLVFGPLYWSILLAFGDILCLIGMTLRPKFQIVTYGAMISFAMWLFLNISLLITAGMNIAFVWTASYLITYAYLFLASSQGVFKTTPVFIPPPDDNS